MMSAEEKIALIRRELQRGGDDDKYRALMRVIEISWPQLWHSLLRVLDR